MKKNILFSLFCAAGFSFAGAQIMPPKVSTVLPLAEDIKLEEPIKLNRSVLNAAPQLKEDLKAGYKIPKGVFVLGLENDLIPYNPTYVGGGSEEIPWSFENLTTGADESTTYSWSIANNVFRDRDLSVILPMGTYETPILTAIGDSRSTYQYGAEKNLQGEKPTAKPLIVGASETLPLTYADYTYGGLSIQFDAEHYVMGSGELGMAGFPFYTEDGGFEVLTEEPIKAKGVVTYFEKPMSPLSINNISVVGLSFSNQPLTDDISLTLEIRKVDENGKVILTGDPLESSKVTSADLVPGSIEKVFIAKFPFTETDEFGIPVEKDFIMDQACAIVITGFDQEGCDFGVCIADATGPGRCGTSWIIMEDGTLGTYIFKEEEQKPRFNAYVQLNGFFPYLHSLSEYAIVPDEGGVATYESDGGFYSPQFISNFPTTGDDAVEIVSEIPDWLTVTPSNPGFDEYKTIVYVVEGEPLPEGVDGRTATLEISNHGLRKSFKIYQGKDAIETISTTAADQYKVVRNGNDFVLSYPAGATSVMVVNALGQNVAQYDLPAGGQTTVPAAVLSNGLNIFKFNGAGNIAVKAMK